MGSDMTKEEFRELCEIAVKNTTENIQVGLTSFTYQIKLIFFIIIFSLQNGATS